MAARLGSAFQATKALLLLTEPATRAGSIFSSVEGMREDGGEGVCDSERGWRLGRED